MKTQCPDCQTIFRVRPDQIAARGGRVRCGNCQHVFNAQECLLDAAALAQSDQKDWPQTILGVSEAPRPAAPHPATETPLDPTTTQELGKAAGLILPRDTTEVPGYSKWAEGALSGFAPLEERPARWPFAAAATVLALTLAGQAAFHFRAELAVGAPMLRPALEALSQAFGSPLPLPTHTEYVSIETSDLQADPARGNLLELNATLRNHAPYAQAYPALELSLTDTQDTVVARRVFRAEEYLPQRRAATGAFAARSDLPVRLWIEAQELGTAGYRLFVFYP